MDIDLAILSPLTLNRLTKPANYKEHLIRVQAPWFRRISTIYLVFSLHNKENSLGGNRTLNVRWHPAIITKLQT